MLCSTGRIYTQKDFDMFSYCHQGLNSNYVIFQERGLPNLVKEMSVIYENHHRKKCVINATGGYKGQTSYAISLEIALGMGSFTYIRTLKVLSVFQKCPSFLIAI